MLIDDPDKARKLAKAICSDVMLYNGTVKEAPVSERPALISKPLQEGRELFNSRVSPALASLFDEAVANLVVPFLGVEPQAIPRGVIAPTPQARSPLSEPTAQQGPSSKLVLVVAIIILAAVAAALLLRH